MKFNININQEKLANYDLTFQEAATIDWLYGMFGSDNEKINNKRVGGFTWISLPHLIEDMPMIRIKSNSGASKLIKKVKDLGFIETHNNKKERKMYAKPTQKMKDLYFGAISKRTQPQVPEETAQVQTDTNQYTNNNTQEDTIIENKITLNPKQGKNPVSRLQSLFSLYFNHTYGFKPKPHTWGQTGKCFKELLNDYSEIQLACLLIVFFNWKGMTDRDPNEEQYLIKNAHSIWLFKAGVSKYEAFVRNIAGWTEEFDKDIDLYPIIRKKISELSTV